MKSDSIPLGQCRREKLGILNIKTETKRENNDKITGRDPDHQVKRTLQIISLLHFTFPIMPIPWNYQSPELSNLKI